MKAILKGCARCGGDLLPDRWDLDGQDMCCVQCGYQAPLLLVRKVSPVLLPSSAARRPAPSARQKVA